MKTNYDMYEYENTYKKKGYKLIAGLDEAGRGPMAGPLVVGMVVLNPKKKVEGLNDSKKLTEKKREELFKEIYKYAIDVEVAIIEVDEVDKLNVYQASKKGMIDCINKAKVKVDFSLTDAMPLGEEFEHLSIIKGDQKSASIAAASIVAKVTRDHIMYELAKEYPLYGLDKNKGYVTKKHLEAIDKNGISPIHRMSFEPVLKIYNRDKKV